MSFDVLGLSEPVLRAVRDEGYTTPTPIQRDAVPHVLAGKDLLGVAQTGTGKTAAFALPMIDRLVRPDAPKAKPGQPRSLILTPTRELAIQIDESFRAYGRHSRVRTAVIFGGVGQSPQVEAVRRGLDVLVATPGRLLDLMSQGHVSLSAVEIFVLDEADRMLDMGFLPDVRRVIERLPKQRQSLFFSATMPPSIADLAARILTEPVTVEVARPATTAAKVVQRVLFVDTIAKRQVICDLCRDERVKRALLFTRTKHGADKLVKRLAQDGIEAMAIHGNKSQGARQRALEAFKSGETPILVATDIAARGIDVDDVTHVINYDVPVDAESYVHRIGRTGRAGASGMALSLCAEEEIDNLRDIEKLIGQRIPVAGDRIGLPEHVLSPGPIGSERRSSAPRRPQGQGRGGNGGGNGGGGNGGQRRGGGSRGRWRR